MNFDEFKESLPGEVMPSLPHPALKALWTDAHDDWDGAHEFVQSDNSRESSWVHAYLHRKEGDLSNAGYWYSRAQYPVCKSTLEAEWEEIARTLLEEFGE